MTKIRRASLEDIPELVMLSEQKRSQYAQHQPIFWRKAENSAQVQSAFFKHLLGQSNALLLIHPGESGLAGFAIGTLIQGPPVYAPGGLTCMVDDYCVASPDLWLTVGEALLQMMAREAQSLGAVQMLVVCGHLDQPERHMLQQTGHSIASEWYVRPLHGSMH